MTLTNGSGSPLGIIAINFTGPGSRSFTQNNTCGKNLAAGKSCIIAVTFAPRVSGPITGALTVTDNASNNPQTVGLTGIGTDPLGSASGRTIPCPPGGVGGNTTCYSLNISCPGIAQTTADLIVSRPTNGSVGTVIFGTGGGGVTFYANVFTYGDVTVRTIVNAGFTAAQIEFSGLPVGWLSGPGGPRKLACRYATAAQWIYNNIHQADATRPFCATGNSGGGSAVAYALAHYGLDSIFDMVEPTSGPPMGRVDYGCLCDQPAKQTPCDATPLSECYGPDAAAFIDPSYNSNICSTHSKANEALFYSDSIASADALFAYPKTDVHVIFGGQDNSEAPPLGMEWIALITTKKTVECVADAPHALPNVLDGATKIANDIINFCHLQ